MWRREWEKFRDIVMECTNDGCDKRRVGRQRRKGSEWWNEEVGWAVAEKRRTFEEWLQRRDRVTYDRCRAKNGGLAMGSDFECNKKMFWKVVKRVIKGWQGMRW